MAKTNGRGKKPRKPNPNREVLNTDDAADLLRIHPQTLWRFRQDGRGPEFSRMGKRIVYMRADVLNWLREQREGA